MARKPARPWFATSPVGKITSFAISRVRTAGAIIALSLLLGGCGPRAEPLFPVEGKVDFRGTPLTEGTVSLRALPTEGQAPATLHHPTGRIEKDGAYRIFTAGRPGAPPGKYRVIVFANEPLPDSGMAHPAMPKSIIPTLYNQPDSTPLAIEVGSEVPQGGYDLRLLENPLPVP